MDDYQAEALLEILGRLATSVHNIEEILRAATWLERLGAPQVGINPDEL